MNIAPLSILGNAARNHKEIAMTMHQPESQEPQVAAVPFDSAFWMAQAAARQAAYAEQLVLAKTSLFDFLAAHGIIRVTVAFDGYGDSGQLEEAAAFGEHGEVDFPEGVLACTGTDPDTASIGNHPVKDVIETLAYDLLNSDHGGWENNDGAYGEFRFDTATRIIKLEFNERFTASDYSETQW